MKKALIIFSGYNQRAVVAFLRTLAELNVDYVIIASSSKDTILSTEYKNKVIYIREQKELNKDELFKCIDLAKKKLDAKKYIVAPSTEGLNRFMLENYEEFHELGYDDILPSKELYEQISDKYSFTQICKSYGLVIPGEYTHSNAKFPFVAKPKKYFSTNNKTYSPVFIRDEAEFSTFKNEYYTRDFYFQEYVSGDSIYILFYFYKNGRAIKLSQENLIQQPNGRSIVAAKLADIHHKKITEQYQNLFIKLQYRGLVMVEVSRQKDDYVMIEANPRFWGPSQLFVDAGVNFFEDMLLDWGVIDSKPKHAKMNKGARYYWSGGVCDDISKMVFHNYDKETYLAENSVWSAYDIYNRVDTREIYDLEKI
ncbi:MAG: ATP-grasp domain-containing protein [Candidatus Nomurabacteria bacterium]|nr:MAG: ATP-grasp domain-containing protein [Candidatus Nomurabacteria bacterium]